MVAAGTVVAGKYRLERPIGKGGMGWVWRAQHIDWNAPVAVKLINPEVLREERGAVSSDRPTPLLQRFFSEARAAAAIRSPHVVQILDHGMDPALHLPFIVTELLEGETLADRLERMQRLDATTTATILTHVARALTRMHENHMVHRDLKPSNVFLVQNDEELVAKVLDFGIAKTRNEQPQSTPITVTGQQMGTPYYMSPEQIRGHKDIDFRADLWAFGVMAFECLTGTRPFVGETIGELTLQICVEPLPLPSRLANVPIEFDAWFLRCVNRDRTLTFASARDAADALRALLTAGSRRTSAAFQDSSRALASDREASPATELSMMSSSASAPRNKMRRMGRRLVVLALVLGGGVFLTAQLLQTSTNTPEPADTALQGSTNQVSTSQGSTSQGSTNQASTNQASTNQVTTNTSPADPPLIPATSATRSDEDNQFASTTAAPAVDQATSKRSRKTKRRPEPAQPPASPLTPAAATYNDLIEDRF